MEGKVGRKVIHPEHLIGLPSFPNGGDREVFFHKGGTAFTLSRRLFGLTLPAPLSSKEARAIIHYNECVETGASASAKSHARRRLPQVIQQHLYEFRSKK